MSVAPTILIAGARRKKSGTSHWSASESFWRRKSEVIHQSRTLNTITASEWREATPLERHRFIESERRRGVVSFACLTCGFPTAHGVSSCESCSPQPVGKIINDYWRNEMTRILMTDSWF